MRYVQLLVVHLERMDLSPTDRLPSILHELVIMKLIQLYLQQ